jgi:tryptophan 2,3-dioxygenase
MSTSDDLPAPPAGAPPAAPPPAGDPPTPVPNYWDYLKLDRLLDLQGGLEGQPDVGEPDELLFIIVHQAYELWFKMVLRELRLAIGRLGEHALEDQQVPHVVHHLRRVGEILRLSVEQFAIVETLTPQDFLSFRDKLVPASGFQSFQMREIEILLGLEDEARERYGETDALEHIRALAARSPAGALAWSRIAAARADAAAGGTLRAGLERWLSRTPIEGRGPADAGDAEAVDAFVLDYLDAFDAWQRDQRDRLAGAGLTRPAELDARFAATAAAARAFLMGEDLTDGPGRAARRRARAGLLFIESHRGLPLLAWPRLLIDTVVEVEEQLVLFRHRHARMVERVIGRRVGTGGSSGVDYLDRTTAARIFRDLWTVRTFLMPRDRLPALANPGFYYSFSAPTGPLRGAAMAPPPDPGV